MLSIANLEVVYHSVVLVLKGVSLEVPEGSIVTLLGPNGAGKTTTLRAITGLLDLHDGEATQGRVEWGGRNLLVEPPESVVAHGIAQVMEGRRILADLTVEENLRAGGYGHSAKVVKDGVERAFDRFPRLGGRRRQLAGYLSGGEQQMLAISRALVSRPRLLLLDEPSLGLAPRVVEEVGLLIREVNADGVSILLVEQNAMLALELADYGYVMENGRIVVDGPSAQLRSDRDVKEFYLGIGGDMGRSYRDVKLYRRRRRWLS